MTRAEHLEWCKQRARLELTAGRRTGDYSGVAASMISDLGKHPETQSSVEVAGFLMLTIRDEKTARDFIEGFN